MPSAPKLDLSIAISQIFGTLLQKQATRLQIKLGGGQTEEVLKNCVYSDQESLLQCVPEKLTAIDVPWNIKSYNTRLIVHTNVFPVHGLILSRESLIFRAVISKTVIPDGNIETIRLKNYDTDDVMELLNFLYMKEIQIDDHNVLKLLRIGNDLLIGNLMQKCEKYLLKNVASHSLEKLFRISKKYKLHSLHDHVMKELHSNMGYEMLLDFGTLSYYEQVKILHTLCKCRETGKKLDDYNTVEFDCGYSSTGHENELSEEEKAPGYTDCLRLSSLSDSVMFFSSFVNGGC